MLVTVLVMGQGASIAHADSAADDARRHFKLGKVAQDAGRYEAAVAEYEAAYALTPEPWLLFNIGQAWRLGGNARKALSAYESYLEKASDGQLADEARQNATTLRLQIKLEASEAERKAAVEDAARQAAAASAARQQAEAEQARRRSLEEEASRHTPPPPPAHLDEEARRRESNEDAAALATRMAHEQASMQQRVDEARATGGSTLRTLGGVCLGIGLVAVFATAAFLVDGFLQQGTLQNISGSWTTADDSALSRVQFDQNMIYGLWAGGGTLIVSGAIMYALGQSAQREAVRRVTEGAPVSIVPLLAPTHVGVLVRF